MSRKNVEDIYPLTSLQHGILFHALYAPQGGAYVEQWPLLVEGALNAEAFHRALGRTVQRHPALRTGFVWEGVPQPLQVVYRQAEVEARHEDWTDAAGDHEWRERLDAWLAEDKRRGFDLKAAPLVRLGFLRVGAERTVVVFTFHHLLIDAWSAGIVIPEWLAFYEAEMAGRVPALPPAPRYRDYIGWLQKQDAGAAEAFWRRTLQDFGAPTPLPFDRGGPDVAQAHAAERRTLDSAASARLNAFARQRGLTVNTVVQGAWALLLARHAGTDDVVFGTTVSGRPGDLPGVERTVGLFINTLPARVPVPPRSRVGEWLVELQHRQAEARQHEHASLVDIQGWSGAPRDRALFGSIVVFENAPAAAGPDDGQVPLRITGLPMVEGSTYPLTLVAVPAANLELRLSYDTRRFSAAAAARMVDGLSALLAAMAGAPDAALADVRAMADGDGQLLESWGRGAELEPHGPLFHRTFEQWAERTPGAVALVADGERLTYAEVNRRANRLAHRLAAMGVGPETRVAVCVERSAELVVALVAVLKAGGCYVPLDPAYPAERLAWMAGDSGAAVLLVRDAAPGAVSSLCPAVLSLAADARAIAAESDANLDVPVAAENLAYAIYTSGSTGRPKGVLVAHAEAAAHCRAAAREYGQTAADRVLQFASASFDVSVEQILTPLSVGAAIVMRGKDVPRPSELAELVRREGVTVVNPPTAYWQELTNDAQACAAVRSAARLVLAGGEAMSTAAARRWLDTPGGARMINVYGPTETVVTSTAQDVDERAAAMPGFVPVGRPMPGRLAYVVDARGRLAGIGEVGELWIGGPLARGYLGRPALTAGRFVPDPFSAIPGARLYRTGDLARWTEDGLLDFLGRADDQVKVRGYRVELGEVEAALATLPGVAATAVAARNDRLVAYVVGRDGAAVDTRALGDALAASLPAHMVPSVFVPLDRLPMTPSGKVDRRALPAPDVSALGAAAYTPPRSATEQALAQVWREVLGVDRVGVQDSFFALGGHSLMAMQVASRIRQAMGLEVPLRTLFDAPTLGGLARRLDELQGGADDGPPLVPALRGATAPLSFAQERMWFLDRLLPGSTVYNLPARLELRGAVDAEALRGALGDLVRRHEPLRTTLAERDGVPVQVVAAPSAFPLPVTDFSHLPREAADRAAERLGAEEAVKPFDLAAGPLFRAHLVRRGADAWTLLMDAHHAVLDGWSAGVLYRDLAALYEARLRGVPASLAPLKVQYADFAVWQREWLSGDRLQKQLAFWRERLEGAPPLELPTDRPRPAASTFRGGMVDFDVPAHAGDAVQALAREEDATPFMALLAAFGLFLWKYTGQDDVTVGSMVAGRNRAETEPLIGMFVNMLPLRMALGGGLTFRQLVRRAREVTLDAHAHQDLPFERLVDELKVERSLARHPVLQVAFTVEERPHLSSWRFGDADAVQPDASAGHAKFDLTVGFTPSAEGLVGGMEYAADLFDHATVQRMARHLVDVLAAAVADPDRPLSCLPGLLRGAERGQVLGRWSQAPHPVPDGAVHELVRDRASQWPDAVAVAFGARSLSYGELEARASRLAHHLRARGVGAEDRVAILAERVPETLVALLAVLKAGAAYLPVDPAHPVEWTRWMLADSGARLVIDSASSAGRVRGALNGVEVLDVAAEADAIEGRPSADPGVEVHAGQLAYVVYTSGSTGRPKGVAVPHGGVPNLALASARRLALRPGDRVLQFTSYSFDVSVSELFATLLTGATLVMAARDALMPGEPLSATLRTERITALHAAPSALGVTPSGDLPELRAVLSAGEALPEPVAARWSRGHTLVNGYGPTEATVYATFDTVGEGWSGSIGRVIENGRVYVVDALGEPLGAGVPGELCIGGVGVVRGYLGRPALTAERFVPDPFATEPGARMYRTGDRARWGAEGRLAFLGRLDDQVKIRGFRVEPGEAAARLLALPDVREAVAVAREDVPGDARLVAYVTPSNPSRPPRPAELRAALTRLLPEYLVPSAIVVLDAFPVTTAGKVDRRALPAPDDAGRHRPYAEPGTETERALAEIWCELLGVSRVGADDGFFEIGGHSLLATRMVSAVRERLHVDVPLRDVFEAPRLSQLAARVAAALAPEIDDLLNGLDGLSEDEILALLDASEAMQ